MSEEKKAYRIEGRPATIFRVVKSADNPYVMIDRRPIDNNKMSWKAKGILTYLMSRPDGWEVSVADLVNHSTDGAASTRAGLKELKNAGHMKYTKMRQAGRITGWLIEVYEIPHSDFLHVENLDVENSTQVLKNLSSNEKEGFFSEKEKAQNEAKWQAIMEQERAAKEAQTVGQAWRGRDLLPTQYLTYADWWVSKTGIEMYGAKAKPNTNNEWFKAFKSLWENDVTIAACDAAFEACKWKNISKPSQIVAEAIAFNAAPAKQDTTIHNMTIGIR